MPSSTRTSTPHQRATKSDLSGDLTGCLFSLLIWHQYLHSFSEV